MVEPLLVIGNGATGRTHQLRSMATAAEGSPPWLIGHPERSVSPDQVRSAQKKTAGVLIADDIQWFTPDALNILIELADDITIVASRRPALGSEDPLVDQLSDVLTREREPIRLGFLDENALAAALSQIRSNSDGAGRAMSTDQLEQILATTAGSVGLASDVMTTDWSGDFETMPLQLVEAVHQRIRRAGVDAEALMNRWCLVHNNSGDEPALSLALRSLPSTVDGAVAHRAARAGGLVDNHDQIIPLVAAALRNRLTGPERGALQDEIATAASETDVVAAATHLLTASGTADGAATTLATAALQVSTIDASLAAQFINKAEQFGLAPAEAHVMRALTHFHDGSAEALAALDSAIQAGADPSGARAALLTFGTDMREMRYESAAKRPVSGGFEESLPALATSLTGEVTAADGQGVGGGPIGAACATTVGGVTAFAQGDASGGLALLSSAADDYDRIASSLPLGFTPHWVGVLVAVASGDTVAARLYAQQAIAQQSGGRGEELAHRAVSAYAEVMEGRYNEALEVLRSAPDTSQVLVQRDRLLLAALEAALARRSGDTNRLRSAWAQAEAALLRPSASWLLMDFYIELLTAGARLGDERRVRPVVNQLASQCAALPSSGPGAAAGLWLQLQVTIAPDTADPAEVKALATQFDALRPADPRSKARAQAASVWAGILEATAHEDEVVATAQALRDVGDLWEASRILGQAALDCEDPAAARRMLELARIGTTEQVDEDSSDGLVALGLSERESEVAVLVAEGRTHKEIGAQLYISPKTVEHHVARIRQKLSAGSRAELLGIIRDTIAG